MIAVSRRNAALRVERLGAPSERLAAILDAAGMRCGVIGTLTGAHTTPEAPDLQAALRAPIYEEKVVDVILANAKVTDVTVSREELFAEDEAPEAYGGEAKPAKKTPAKKAKAKAESAPEAEEATEAKPAKKKAAPKKKADAE